MKLVDLWKEIKEHSGEFILPEASLEVTLPVFKTSVKYCLKSYNKYSNYISKFNMEVTSNIGEPIQFSIASVEMGRVPDKVLKVVPTLSYSNATILSQLIQKTSQSTGNAEKLCLFYEYRDGKLYMPTGGRYDIHASWDYVLDQALDANGDVIEGDWEIKKIEDSSDFPNFIDMLKGRFMETLGRSRSIIDLSEVTMTNNAQRLIDEGQLIYKNALDDLAQNNGSLWKYSYS